MNNLKHLLKITKEEIQAQIDIIEQFDSASHFSSAYFKLKLLQTQLKEAKSIQDLQKEAFEAGRKYRLKNTYEFESFEDYLKSKEK